MSLSPTSVAPKTHPSKTWVWKPHGSTTTSPIAGATVLEPFFLADGGATGNYIQNEDLEGPKWISTERNMLEP